MASNKKAGESWERLGPDKVAFFVAFLMGAVTIVALDLLGTSKVIAVVICAALMIVYAASTIWVPGIRLRPDQTADNTYYMGLLFTLTSLGVALYRFAGDDLAAQSILRNFGIAIFTTIVGLALRVLISQFRQDPEDLEREAKEALADTVRVLRGQLDQAIGEMQSFVLGVRQAAEETISELQRQSSETLTTSLKQFTAVASQISAATAAEGETINQRLRHVVTSFDGLTSSIGELSRRIDDIEIRPDALSQAIEPALNALNSSMGSLAEQMAAQSASIGDSLASLDNLRDSLQRLSSSSESLAGVSRSLETAVEPLRQIERGLTTLESSVRGAAGTIDGLNKGFSESHDAVVQVRRELAELAGWITARLDQAA